MTLTEKRKQLSSLISEQLTPLIDADYIFLDLPYYSNIGDTLIWQGTEDFLATLPYKCLYRSAIASYRKPAVGKEVIILLQGGGNFGDLYYQHNRFRNEIIRQFPENRIIILPQTLYYVGYGRIVEDAAVLSKHPHLYICARDTYSYDFLKRYRMCQNVLLVPDMAFYISEERLQKLSMPTTDKILFFKRTDNEQTVDKIDSVAEYDSSDWPLYEEDDVKLQELYNFLEDDRTSDMDSFAVNQYLPERVAIGVRFISQYKRVYSNRLHGAILSVLLGKQVSIIDNTYGKNAQFYDTWLSDADNVSLVRVPHKKDWKRVVKLKLAYWMRKI